MILLVRKVGVGYPESDADTRKQQNIWSLLQISIREIYEGNKFFHHIVNIEV